MSVIARILACEGCGYSGSTFGNADWLTVDMACPNGCGGKVIAFVPATDQGAVDALRWALGFIEYQGEPTPLDDPREGEADAEAYARAQAIVGGQ
jgi:hypothetical protein